MPLTREGDDLDDLSSLPSGLEIGPTEILSKLEGGLCLAAHESDFACLGIRVLEGRGVDGDGFIEQMADSRGDGVVEIGLMNGEILMLFVDV